jgi:hypothetical protein
MAPTPAAPQPTANSGTTVFTARRWLLVVYVVLGAVFILQGSLTALFFLIQDADGLGMKVLSIAISLFLAWLGYWFAAMGVRRLRDRDSPIVIGPAGLHDRALSERPIPWRDIVNLRVWHGRGGPILTFDLAPGGEERAGIHRRVRPSVPLNRQFGYSYHVHAMGTDAGIDRLVDAVSPFANVDRGGW